MKKRYNENMSGEPGTEVGDSAVKYWVDIAVNSDHPLAPLAHVPGIFAVLWTDETAANTVFTLGTAGTGSVLKGAMGPLKQWVRVGPSYSKALGQNISLSIRWGASPARNGMYVRQIPSAIMIPVPDGNDSLTDLDRRVLIARTEILCNCP